MNRPLLTLEVRLEPDVVLARQRARQIAGLLGFTLMDQTRIATAVSEIARNAFQYAGGGKVEFLIKSEPVPEFVIRVRERGPGINNLREILEGRYESTTGLGVGIRGAKRLMDQFEIETSDEGATVTMTKGIPHRSIPFSGLDLGRIASQLAQHAPQSLLEELQVQNQELFRALQELRDRQAEIAELHSHELDETNRGVVALYSELDKNANELRRISDMKSRFLSNMSHEFRSPLNTILSMSGFLLNGQTGELTSEQRTEISFIRKAAEGLAALVNDLLDLAKVEAGKAVIRLETFEVADLFETLRGTTTPLLSHGSVSLIVEEPIGIPPLQTDQGKVAQILRNFLSNAAKFTERGEIRLSAKNGPGDAVTFSVADTGIGIAPEDQSRVFEEFSQIENPVQKRVKGTGLGLPLCWKLADLLGGKILLQSQLGVGSTFLAIIPRSYRAPEDETVMPEARWHLDPLRAPVLVIDDDPVGLSLYEKLLAETGFQILSARTLEEASHALQHFRPLAVILDFPADEQRRWQWLAGLKAETATQQIPVLVTADFDAKERALSVGTLDFRLKPVDREWLLLHFNALKETAQCTTVLIIDDEEAARYTLKGLLAAQGRFVIMDATNGEEGIRKAREEKPEVIFLDLIMPEMTGFEVLQRLKGDDVTKPIPVIINTSTTLDEETRRELEHATAAIVSKSSVPAEQSFVALRDALVRAGLTLSSADTES